LSDGNTESFLDRFLKDNGGSPLKGVDFNVRFGRQLEDMDIRIVSDCSLDFRQHRFAFRIMHHTGTGYDQAAIVLLLHQSIGLDGARWVLEPFEASQLQQYGFVSRNAKALEDLVDFQEGYRQVLLTQWINRWRNQELGDGKAMRESGERKNGRVISNQEATEKAPAVLPGLGNVEVAAPEPLPSLPVLDQCRGRGIMD